MTDRAGFAPELAQGGTWRGHVRQTPAGVALLPHGTVAMEEALALAGVLERMPERLVAPLRGLLADPALLVVADLPPGPSRALELLAPLSDMVTLVLLASIRPIAALLQDLKAGGLLDDTLVIWGGEFGRTPTSEGAKGRDHHSRGFSMWLAGGGVRGGHVHGATDELGIDAVEDRVHAHDLHATILHLMGVDHERLTYRYSGRDFRLTDVHGRVVTGVLA